MYDDDISLGIAVFLPTSSFQVEVSRKDILDTIKEIDDVMDKNNFDQDVEVRTAEIVLNAANISSLMAEGEMEANDAITQISYNFIYVFAKTKPDELKSYRGIVCLIQGDNLYIEGYEDQESYHECTEILKGMAATDEDEDMTPNRPTIH